MFALKISPVQVPLLRFSVAEVMPFSYELVQLGKQESDLPDPIERSLARIGARYEITEGILTDRQFQEVLSGVLGAVYQKERSALRGVHGFVGGLADLPVDEAGHVGERARLIYNATFPEGLNFLSLPAHKLWWASEVRLQSIRERFYDELVEYGGRLVLRVWEQVHSEYAEVLGLTHGDERPTDPTVRDAVRALLKAVRAHILQVTAWVEDQPQHIARGERLLRPLEKWAGIKRKQGTETGEPGDLVQ